MKYLKQVVLTSLLTATTVSPAAPTGADVLAACEKALSKGFHGTVGMMCIWYVTPCDCQAGKDPAIPRVCLPEDKAPETLAKEVVEGLKQQPALLNESAEVSAGRILAPKYPCS